MTDNLIERAKAALENATPGPWLVDPENVGKSPSYCWQLRTEYGGTPVYVECERRVRGTFKSNHATANLVALAPDLARALIREREAAERLAEAAREARNIANLAFGAGIEECEGGSVRRQGKLVDDYERRIDAINNALAAYRKATKETDDDK